MQIPLVRILCVEADDDLYQLLSLMLKSEGFDVHLAITIEQALQMVTSHLFGLYIVDDHFNGGDGVDFIRQIRATNKGVPIIMSWRGHTLKTSAKDWTLARMPISQSLSSPKHCLWELGN